MSAVGFLKRVAQVLEERGAAYGDPKAQMEAIAQRWSITLGTPVTAQQVALCMIDLKLARLAHDPGYADGPIDVIGYAALIPEIIRGSRS
ncbi:DUF6378 domain-containing protein [Novosphingobium sp. NPDC080210]|uniref:DUF6378 domain-containing protein n=1 Tax=Novosphingobium sp. NPDC080210 TaxID=3390596 RepID=UPI003CFF9BA9